MAIRKYGLLFPDQCNELTMELYAFRQRIPTEKGGLGTYGHFRNITNTFWPKLEWHTWAEDACKGLCNYQTNAWTGCAAAGKTYTAGVFSMAFFAADPDNTSVVLTSTTGKMVRKRIWPVIQELYRSAKGGFVGNLVDSKTTLQSKKGDDKHGIFAVAVADGQTSKAVADIQGLHSKRMLIIIDEATDTPEAIFEALPNLQKGCSDFIVLVIGNPVSHLDPHGKACEPRNEWSSISIEDDEWETKGVAKWDFQPGICLHFDGTKSPNIKLGRDKWPFIFTNRDLEKVLKNPGAKESVGFWKYTRGFWAPEGICKTVFSVALVEKYDGYGKHVWISGKKIIAALDPSFGGGDRCVLRFAELGDLGPDKMGVQLTETVEIRPKAESKEPIHYQIAHRVISECKARGVKPEDFAMDATGEGGGLADIISKEWNGGKENDALANIVRVEFGGSPSELPVSATDQRTCKEAYDRKVTELWYSAREFLQSSQLKGLTPEDVIEFCGREFTDEKRKIILDTKKECKAKIGRSPDLADAVTIVCELARRLGVTAGGQAVKKINKAWESVTELHNNIYANGDHLDEPELLDAI